MSLYYNLFLRNWLNNRATKEQIDQAVPKFLTQNEAEEIKNTER